MRKTLSFLMAGLLVFCLAGCNNENNPETNIDNETNETQVNEPKVNEPEVEEDNGLSYGDEGDGEFVVDTPIAKFTIPEGMHYEVKSDYISEDGKTATIELGLEPLEATQFGNIRITNQGMVDSYEKAIEHTIALQNLDTYDEGKYELLDEVEYAGIKYQTIKTSTEWGTDYFLAGYKGGWEIVVKMPEKDGGFTIDSDEVKSIMESLSVVDLE